MNLHSIFKNFMQNRSFLILVLLFPLFSFSQNYKLHPDLKGYDGCNSKNNPLACLENTLSSIEHDMGFYASLDKTGEAFYISQYCLQIAYVYRQLGFSQKCLQYLIQAKEAYDNLDPNYKPQMTSTIGRILVYELDEFCRINSSPKCDEWFGKDMTAEVDAIAVEESIEEMDISETDQVKDADLELTFNNINSSLLKSLSKYIDENPISQEFTNTHASDSCVLHITQHTSSSERVLDCYLEHSWHIDLVGQHLMGLSKEIDYDKALAINHVDMTILVRPNSKDEVTYNDGKFYVYYKNP